MTYQEKVRTKLEKKIFNSIGKTVTFINKQSPIYNTRGEVESSITAPTSSITIVPYSIINDSTDNQAFGTISTGEFEAAVPYDVTVNRDDEIILDAVYFKITEVRKNYLPDNVVTIIKLQKIIN
jgi:hypothetical protein